ncbi:HAD family phosphatase [Listeria welshimeri]|uniref:Cof-type HAD-IIB family hydrolase n=1 Tax=Listeria welshimeri TaxID=1643 RepID=UPI001887C89C|nr:Cof-type HAD-IIB family hydrolase [Listeria welshimeri]MBF2565201.1 HAD family phosphatase [Listeria welshimeri]
MIKVIASDMDGTLLNSDIEIAQENVEAIEKARAKGIHFVLCTGRMYDDAMGLINKVNLYAPAICMNGAEIRDEHGKIILQHPIDRNLARNTYNTLTELGMYTEFFTDMGPITTDKARAKEFMIEMHKRIHPDIPAEAIMDKVEERFESKDVHEIPDVERILGNKDLTILKFISFSSDKDILAKAKKKLEKESDLSVTSSFSDNIEITHREAQKGISLQYYVEKLGVTLDETFAIGDNMNDISMLKMAGYSVAMGNAEEEVKDLAKHVTLSNDEHGVASAIYKMLETND